MQLIAKGTFSKERKLTKKSIYMAEVFNSKYSCQEIEELLGKTASSTTSANVGDIVMYDATLDKVVLVKYDIFNMDVSKFPSDRYTPIGVVAIPSSHNVYGNGSYGVMSLKHMNYDNPNEGTVEDEGMCWGYNDKLLGKAYDKCIQAGTLGNPTEEATGEDTYGYLPSDFQNNAICPNDAKAWYYDGSSSSPAVPSPYLTNGSRNPVYSQVSSPSSGVNMLSDFNGRSNTQLILDNVTVSDWKTAETIEDSTSEGNYPAACCCWRFSTKGVQQGAWYLPACGEIGYVLARTATINATINKLIEVFGEEIACEILAVNTRNRYYWTSTEYSASYARFGYGCSSHVGSYGKGTTLRVRAFLRLAL